jgi:hypothetical protein
VKVFFASLTQPELEVDAHVNSDAQGILILDALRRQYSLHGVILRARVKRFGFSKEHRFIGEAAVAEAFIEELRERYG